MKDGVDLLEYASLYDDAAGCCSFVLAGRSARRRAAPFDWSRLSAADDEEASRPAILSGGLDPDNVGEAIRCRASVGGHVSSASRNAVRMAGTQGIKTPRYRGVHRRSAQC